VSAASSSRRSPAAGQQVDPTTRGKRR